MHSGLVAFLYTTVSFSAVPLPTTIEDQGEWWAQHYHDGVGAAGRFTEKAEQMSNHTGQHFDRLDFCPFFLIYF